MAVEMHESCPSCGSDDYSFITNDEAECNGCGERFYPDVSGRRYEGAPIGRLYHVTSAEPDEFKSDGLDAERNTHGWVYLTRNPKAWLDYFTVRPDRAVFILEINTTDLVLFHDPAGYEADFYVEQTITPDRITRSYRYDPPES